MSSVPIIDLTPWFHGDDDDRRRVGEQVDTALREIGFLLITGHGVPAGLRDQVRTAVKRFFALPEEVKRRYAATVGERGWLPPGVEANGYAEGTETPPDLKESYSAGADLQVGDLEVDGFWFQTNLWPD